jgi:hypothetical protein
MIADVLTDRRSRKCVAAIDNEPSDGQARPNPKALAWHRCSVMLICSSFVA